MRFFVIQQKGNPVAIIFHDHLNQMCICRSKVMSFLSVFNAVCLKKDIQFVKEKGLLRAISRGPFEYDWVDNILDHLCKDLWSVHKQGEMISSESNINEMIHKYLT